MPTLLPPFRLSLASGDSVPVEALDHDGVLELSIAWDGSRHPLTLRPDQVPPAELEAVAELVGLAGNGPVALFRIEPLALSFATLDQVAPVPGVASALPPEVTIALLEAMFTPTSRFPLAELGTVSHPAPPATASVRYVLARYDAALAARAEAHSELDAKGEQFGWADWRSWAGDLTAADWGALTDPQRLLAITSARIRADERDAAVLTPHFAGFSERAPDADGAPCTYCSSVGRPLYRVSAAEADDAVTAGAREHGRTGRLMCEPCLATNQGRQLDEGRREALEKLRGIWTDGRLASGSFSGDLHALSVVIGGKDGYFTIAERQAKELVDLLTGGQVTDLTAEKSVAEQGADALFFANRGLFSASDRAYIAVEVKTTASAETLVNQIVALADVVRNEAARALFKRGRGEGRTLYAVLTPEEQAVIDAPGALKRWYRFYVAQFVYRRLARTRSLAPALEAARDRLAPFFDEPVDPAERALFLDASARGLEPLVESVLMARFTSLDGKRDQTPLERIAPGAAGADAEVGEQLAAAISLAQAYFDSYLCFDLFGEPISGLCASSLPAVDQGAASRALAGATGLLTRLRVYRHARNHPAHYPREAVMRLTREASGG
jgi:hypothetical protein